VTRSGDTIAAASSPPGRGARGVVRVSGPGAARAHEALAGAAPRSRGRHEVALRLGPRWPPVPAVAVWLPGPGSFTGEDTLELHLSGCPPLVERVLRAARRAAGARRAAPGEFTRRAFENGRIDLGGAEAVLRLIHAAHRDDLREACRHLSGERRRELAELRARLIDLLARLEAELDFSGEDVRLLTDDEARAALAAAGAAVAALLAQCGRRPAEPGRFRAVLAGAVNAGKSSLFNALLGRRRVLVSPRPGTTRDRVVGRASWEGLEVALCDSPGVEGAAPLPGVECDLVLLVLDGAAGLPEAVRPWLDARELVVVVNKCDLAAGGAEAAVERLAPDRPRLRVSALAGTGVAALRGAIAARARGTERWSEPPGAAGRRRARLEEAAEELAAAESVIASGEARELVAHHVRAALRSLAELAGETTTEEMLDRLFAEFCIGK
jgi:tRNA modification GTPase